MNVIVNWLSEYFRIECLVCIYKDFVKIGVDCFGSFDLWVLCVEMKFVSGEDDVVVVFCFFFILIVMIDG